jgi:hypothetical protein
MMLWLCVTCSVSPRAMTGREKLCAAGGSGDLALPGKGDLRCCSVTCESSESESSNEGRWRAGVCGGGGEKDDMVLYGACAAVGRTVRRDGGC